MLEKLTPTRAFTHRTPEDLLNRIDAYADAHGISRTAAINSICATAVSAWESHLRMMSRTTEV